MTFSNDHGFKKTLGSGYGYSKKTFSLNDATPRYCDCKTLPIDIQCSFQANDTFVFLPHRDSESIQLTLRVAPWTIQNMQDTSGYFYRGYSDWRMNKGLTLHWGAGAPPPRRTLSALVGQ
jgi:hypothetical protein